MKDSRVDPFGLKALILSKGMTLSGFARACNASPQAMNNWIERGLPGHKLFDAADVLDMPADELRPYTSDGRKPQTEIDAEIRRFIALFARMDARKQQQVMARLRDKQQD